MKSLQAIGLGVVVVGAACLCACILGPEEEQRIDDSPPTDVVAAPEAQADARLPDPLFAFEPPTTPQSPPPPLLSGESEFVPPGTLIRCLDADGRPLANTVVEIRPAHGGPPLPALTNAEGEVSVDELFPGDVATAEVSPLLFPASR